MTSPRLGGLALAAIATAAATVAIFSAQITHALSGEHSHTGENALSVDDVAGFTRVGVTKRYLVVVNVLPGEEMFSVEEVAEHHPTVGEMEIRGEGQAVMADSRHIEAHIYDRESGLALAHPVPTIEVVDLANGSVSFISSVLMQDVVIGETDIHFGDNVVVPGGTDLRIRVNLGPDEEVVFDGYLS